MFDTEKDIKKLIEKVKTKDHRHRYYFETVNHAERMGVHMEGKTPLRLLEEYRPNEEAAVREYRLKIWRNVTESLAGKVLHTIAKIFDPKLFNLKIPESPSGLIPEEESLEFYLTKNFGIYNNIWIFIRETLLTKELSDPNSLCLVFPQALELEDTEYFEPVPLIFPAKTLIDFVDGEYYILWIPEERKHFKHIHPSSGELWIITEESIKRYWVKGETFKLDFEIETGFLPAFRLGGVVKGERNPYWYKSFIGGVEPHWDKVVNMVSDLDGSIVNHLFPTPWEWTVECNTCQGSGSVRREDIAVSQEEARDIICESCKGSGRLASKGPYGGYDVKRDAINPELPNPIPPAGFITKDIAPIQELREIKDEEVLKGFEAINMEVVHRVGENQSGIAKTIDRADLDSMLMRIAQHIFEYNVIPIIDYVIQWRYGSILSEQQIREYQEGIEISKPKDFSVLGVNMLMEELKAAGTSNVSTNYLRQLESEIVSTRFSNNEQAKKKNLAIIELKPFPGKTDDEVSLGVANGTIQKRDGIRNANIDELVTLAIEQDDDFLDMEFSDKLAAINQIIDENYLDEEEVPTVPVEGDIDDEIQEEIEEESLDEEEDELDDGGEEDE